VVEFVGKTDLGKRRRFGRLSLSYCHEQRRRYRVSATLPTRFGDRSLSAAHPPVERSSVDTTASGSRFWLSYRRLTIQEAKLSL